MTNDLTIEFLRRTDTGLSNKAADLIEQLQRERDEARDRLAQAERATESAIIKEGNHHYHRYQEGFRAAIESAAEKARIHMLGMSRERSDKMQRAIRSLTPTDKPAAPSVADHDIIEFRGIGNYYGTLCLKRENGQDYWTIENYDGHDWAKIPDELGSALRALAAREGE